MLFIYPCPPDRKPPLQDGRSAPAALLEQFFVGLKRLFLFPNTDINLNKYMSLIRRLFSVEFFLKETTGD